MREEARNRIDNHRLIHRQETVRIERTADSTLRRVQQRQQTVHRIWVHLIVFFLAYIFTTGASVLGVLLWVRPDGLLALVVVGLLAACVFVGSFAALRFLVLHRLMQTYTSEEEDPGDAHHVGKSVMYGVVALVVAALLTGLLVNVAAASSAAV